MVEIRYPGDELELFATARNWRNYWTSVVADLLTGDVLEVGAGVGSVTRLMHARAKSWRAIEPDAGMAARIEEWARSAVPRNVTVACGTIADLPSSSGYDTILYADVLEHIEDDAAEIKAASRLLRDGGCLVVLGPAHPGLFSPFDEHVGHYRRYTAHSLRAIAPPGSRELVATYLDSVGMLVSLANRWVLRSSHPTPRQIGLWTSGSCRFREPWTQSSAIDWASPS